MAAAALANLGGCEPATPHAGALAPSSPDGGAATSGLAPIDAGVGTTKAPTLQGPDATGERNALVSGSGDAASCTTVGVGTGSDAGIAPVANIDAAGTDALRDAGAGPPPVEAGRATAGSNDSGSVGTSGGGGAGNSTGSAGTSGTGSGGATGSGGGGTAGTGSNPIGGRGGAPGGGMDAGLVEDDGGRAAGGTSGDTSSPPGPAPGPNELAIVELLINPAGTDTGREWIEIVNRTGHALDLSGLHISDAANDAAVSFGSTPGAGNLLPAGVRAVLIQSVDPTKNGGVSLAGDAAGGAFGTLVSLNNDADTISLCVGPCATGILIDRVVWDATLGTGYDGHALVIDDAGRRCPATLPFGDAGSFGTPGNASGPCP